MRLDFGSITEYIMVALATFVTFITPIIGFMIIVSLAVVTDTVYAISSRVKKHGWSVYRSTYLFNIVPKTFFYMGTILFAYLLDVYIIADNHIYGIPMVLTKVITVLWTYIEVKSIDERRVKNGKRSMYSILKDVMGKFKTIKKDLKSEEDEV